MNATAMTLALGIAESMTALILARHCMRCFPTFVACIPKHASLSRQNDGSGAGSIAQADVAPGRREARVSAWRVGSGRR